MRTRYLLPCPCGRKVLVEAFQAGQRIHCQCGAELDAPTMLGLAQLEQAEPDPVADARGPTWGIPHGLALLGGIVCLAGLAAVIVLWLGRPKGPDMSRIAPAQAMRMWHDFRQGIGTPPSPWEQSYIDASRWHLRWLTVAGAVALVGALIFGSARLVKGGPAETPPPQDGPNPDARGAS